jgi:6-pyruvoyltetrahydropterin/6-carboxytetrahydropterin synthase
MNSEEQRMSNQASVTRSYKFCAAHRLHVAELPDDVNQKIFGKCNNANGHGHNYTVLVTIKGDMDSTSGQVTDLDHLDRLVQEKIVQRFDHRHLNYDPAFMEVNPTGENICVG